jgi:hypothetical protein
MILVSILGDFHSSIFPIYYEFKDKISTHIVVHDDAFSEYKKNKKIIASLKKFNKKSNLEILTKEFIIDEDNLESIYKLIKFIKLTTFDLKNIYINTTDGLSNIGIILSAKLLKKGVKFLSYDMRENTYNVITQDNIINKKLKKQMSIKEHFLLKGLDVVTSTDKEYAHKNAKHIIELFEKYYDEFLILKKDITKRDFSRLNRYKNAAKTISKIGLNHKKDFKKITGGLFELYVYLLIKDLGFDDIELGLILKQKFSKKTTITNEFDILLMKENHLHMIECKFSKKLIMKNIIYKYSSLINLIDDDGKVILLTDKNNYSPNLFDNIPSLEHHRRALLNNILVRGSVIKNKQKFIEDVKLNFNIY